MIASARDTVRGVATDVAAGRRSARDLIETTFDGIDAGTHLGAFWELDRQRALADASAVDSAVRAGRNPGPLAGVPIAVKNAIAVRGLTCGGGAPSIPAARDASIVLRLRRLGGIIVGSTAMHQLGMGMSGQTPGHPACRNPFDCERQPGGSSSGSAVAVAADLVPLAVGTDSAGSVRQPAAWCGVVGVKPHRQAISRAGIVPLASLLDTVGLLAKTPDDARWALEALAERASKARVRGLRAGVDERAFELATATVQSACDAALQILDRKGVVLVPCPPPVRGVRLGPIFDRELADRFPTPQPWMGGDVRASLARGAVADSGAYRAAIRALIAARRSRIDPAIDAVIGPTCPIDPPRLDEPDDVASAGRLTRPFNVLDWPAISVPTGRRTVGLQIAAPRGHEPAMWAIAEAAFQAQSN